MQAVLPVANAPCQQRSGLANPLPLNLLHRISSCHAAASTSTCRHQQPAACRHQRQTRDVRVASSMYGSWRDYFADVPTATELRRELLQDDEEEESPLSNGERFSSVNMARIKIQKQQSSWNARERDGGRNLDADYLSEIGGKQLYNINVDHGQNVEFIDSLFTGEVLGHKSDIADGSLRAYDFRTFNNIVGDYYVAPEFLMKVAMHMAKNYLFDLGFIDSKCRVPLILGIWGEKGMGKTFQTELALKQLGAETVVMSAGELEHEWAGTPGKLIRERYRKGSDMSKVRGKMTCLLIHDIDAGLGHFKHVQVTVNNQIVIGTLMNLCDSPNCVSTGQDWNEKSVTVRRTPIIVTGNDFSKMFAPLIRDGRMDKYYWKPTREDLVNIVWQMYKEDGVSQDDISRLLDRFPRQPLDFFGALRASLYDDQIRHWLKREITGTDFTAENANMGRLHSALVDAHRDSTSLRPPTFEPVLVTLASLVAEGVRLEAEQEHVMTNKLSKEYLKVLQKKKKHSGPSMIGLQG